MASQIQYSCLENPMERGAWWATVQQGLKESETTEAIEHAQMHPYNGKLFSDKNNELLSHKKSWKKLKCVLLSERSQSKKVAYYMITIM